MPPETGRDIDLKIMIMDGQGGGVGRSLVEELHKAYPEAELIAVGTNAVATANMMRGGTALGATGERGHLQQPSGRCDRRSHRHCHGKCHAGRNHPQNGGGGVLQ